MEWISSLLLINVEIILNTKTRLNGHGYFHIYWSKSKILFYACVEEGCSASLTIVREKQT